jgi:hypothetical protein
VALLLAKAADEMGKLAHKTGPIPVGSAVAFAYSAHHSAHSTRARRRPGGASNLRTPDRQGYRPCRGCSGCMGEATVTGCLSISAASRNGRTSSGPSVDVQCSSIAREFPPPERCRPRLAFSLVRVVLGRMPLVTGSSRSGRATRGGGSGSLHSHESSPWDSWERSKSDSSSIK